MIENLLSLSGALFFIMVYIIWKLRIDSIFTNFSHLKNSQGYDLGRACKSG